MLVYADNGWLKEPVNVDSLMKAILDAIADKTLNEKLKFSLSRISRFSFDHIAEQYLNSILRIIS